PAPEPPRPTLIAPAPVPEKALPAVTLNPPEPPPPPTDCARKPVEDAPSVSMAPPVVSLTCPPAPPLAPEPPRPTPTVPAPVPEPASAASTLNPPLPPPPPMLWAITPADDDPRVSTVP